ncbi:MAG: aminomethyl-transferring glycine dehydrogenase subunit GcvPA [Clostridiales bacterium]|nr:aminomethyl-transferring glycine dehydrogenase subunit GcvPA [Clostridiales bacterium]
MSYVPNTARQVEKMLESIGKNSIDDLFADIPEDVKLARPLNLDQGKTEFEVLEKLEALADKNEIFKTSFLGAGAYRHYIPSLVGHLANRAEFVTAYTPYQAEISQGVLKAIFEYQTTVCELTGMDLANAGLYDGAHAAAEAAMMFKERKRIKTLVSAAAKPMVIETVKTYCDSAGTPFDLIPAKDGKTDLDALKSELDDTVASVYIEYPNFYGLIEDAKAVADLVHGAGAKFIIGAYPIALAVLKTPAQLGADAAVGEAQPLGMPLAFGGPYLGYMAVTSAHMRKLPGRIAGQTTDKNGKTAYVLTLQAREQHIRREKAGSSICTNAALCALTATIYCAAMGKEGLIEVAEQCYSKAHYAAEKISSVKGYTLTHQGEFFNEFLTACPEEPDALLGRLRQNGILGGLPIEIDGKNHILWCLTEVNNKAEIDNLAELLKEGVK